MEVTTKETTVEVLPTRIVTEVLFERFRVEVSIAGRTPPQAFDSAEPAPTGEAADSDFVRRTAPFRRWAGATVTMRQRRSGLIEEFEGLDALRTRLLEGVAEDSPHRKAIEGLASQASLQSILSHNMLVPSGSVAVGTVSKAADTRLLPETAHSPGLLYYSGDYKLAEVQDGKARVEIRGEVSLDPYPGMVPWPQHMAPYRARLRLDRGTFKGWARIALDKGVLEEDEHTTEVDLVFLKPDGSGEVPMPTRLVRSTKLVK